MNVQELEAGRSVRSCTKGGAIMELLARTCHMERMNVQRILARSLLLLGGVFWVAMVWGASWAYQGQPFARSLGNAAVFAAIVIGVFALGLFYEYLAAIVLAVFAVGVIVWGVVSGWESGVWATAAFVILLPAIASAALYAAAARMQRICAY